MSLLQDMPDINKSRRFYNCQNSLSNGFVQMFGTVMTFFCCHFVAFLMLKVTFLNLVLTFCTSAFRKRDLLEDSSESSQIPGMQRSQVKLYTSMTGPG